MTEKWYEESEKFRAFLERKGILNKDERIECEHCGRQNYNLKVTIPCNICGKPFQQWADKLYTYFCEACSKR
jgi:ribosomal protein L37E